MNPIISYLLARAAEASTWRGLALLVSGAFGYNLSSTQLGAIAALGLAVSGAIGVLLPDKFKS